jgi:hypothetical protein
MKKIYTLLLFCSFGIIAFSQEHLPKLQYIYPKPNSIYVNPEVSLILGFDKALTADQITSLDIRLTSLGHKIYTIHVIPVEQNKKLLIKHPEAFQPGETIMVSVNTGQIGAGFDSYSFKVSENTWKEDMRGPIYEQQKPTGFKTLKKQTMTALDDSATVLNGVSVPSDFPFYEPGIEGETAPGYLFLSNWSGNPYIMILENDGTPFYYQRVEATSIDFKLQPTGVLTRHISEGVSRYVSMDSNYHALDTFMCQNGYDTDEHDIQLLDNGNALLIAIESRTIDMSAVVPGGQTEATVVGNHVQEIDSNNNVVFEFNCFDHFDITGAVEVDLTANYIDYVHMNSIAVDYDSNIVISSRNLSECTKIDRQTGDIIWRLGGKNNQFTFDDPGDSIDYQHDIRPVPGVPDNYTIFDNGNNRGYTRVVEYHLDTTAMTATKVWEYRPDPDVLNQSMGSAQRLSNGNTLINWAAANLPKATEVNPAGDVLYEGNFLTNSAGYRTFRFEWNGYLEEPYLIVEPLPEKTRLIFNKFGDTTVTEYRVYGGTSPSSEDLITSTTDTWVDIDSLENNQTYYFKVTAVNDEAVESGFSNTESIYIRYPTPGDELIRNGDFSDGTEYWNFYLYGSDAEGIVNADTQFVFTITDGGTYEVGVQLRQNGISLYQGYDYVFEFDAKADNPRTIAAKVGMDVSPYTNYSKIGTTYITDEMDHYSYEFTMDDPTDLNCRVVFNCGNSTDNVTIDNVSLYIKEADTNTGPDQVAVLKVYPVELTAFPNPATDEVTLHYTLPETGTIELSMFDITGREVYRATPVDASQKEGTMTVDMTKFQTGIYMCAFKYLPENGKNEAVIYRKVIKSD